MQLKQTRSLWHHIVAIAAAAMLALGAAFTLGGCAGTSDEDVIRDGVTKTLDAFKNPTKENLTPYIGELDTDQVKQLEAYGLDVYEFFGHAFKNFDYQLGDIAVDGDKATAAVKIQNTDVSKVARGVIDKVQNDESIAAEVQKIAEKGDQAEVMKFVFSLIYEELDATTETATTDVQLTLTKTNNEWRIDEDSFYTMVNGMYGGMEV